MELRAAVLVLAGLLVCNERRAHERESSLRILRPDGVSERNVLDGNDE